MEWVSLMLRPEIVWAPVAVSWAIVWCVVSLAKHQGRHKERLAMIQQGIDPVTCKPFDAPED